MKKKIFGAIVVIAIIAFAVTYFVGGHNAKAAAGSYVNVSVFPENHFTVNENETWDATLIKDHSHATIISQGTVSGDVSGFTLENKVDTEDSIVIHRSGEFYYREDKAFAEDDEYGKGVEFDDNGHCNQYFASRHIIEPEQYYGSVYYGDFFLEALEFKDDGTFSWHYGSTDSHDSQAVEYQGTYTLDGEVITLNFDNADHYLIYKNNQIYYDVFKKQ